MSGTGSSFKRNCSITTMQIPGITAEYLYPSLGPGQVHEATCEVDLMTISMQHRAGSVVSHSEGFVTIIRRIDRLHERHPDADRPRLEGPLFLGFLEALQTFATSLKASGLTTETRNQQ